MTLILKDGTLNLSLLGEGFKSLVAGMKVIPTSLILVDLSSNNWISLSDQNAFFSQFGTIKELKLQVIYFKLITTKMKKFRVVL